LELFRRAGDQIGYSDSFWQIRLQWFQERFSLFATLFLIALIAYVVLGRILRRWRPKRSDSPKKFSKAKEQFRHAFYILKHPIDGFTALRFENKGGYAAALIILAAAYISILVNRVYTSFTFNRVEENSVN